MTGVAVCSTWVFAVLGCPHVTGCIPQCACGIAVIPGPANEAQHSKLQKLNATPNSAAVNMHLRRKVRPLCDLRFELHTSIILVYGIALSVPSGRPRQSEDKPVPLIYLVRRKIYETVAEGQSLGCPVSILLEGAPRERSGLDVDGQLLQMELHLGSMDDL